MCWQILQYRVSLFLYPRLAAPLVFVLSLLFKHYSDRTRVSQALLFFKLSSHKIFPPYILLYQVQRVDTSAIMSASTTDTTSAPHVSWKSRVLGKGFSSTGVYTILPSRNSFSPNDSLY